MGCLSLAGTDGRGVLFLGFGGASGKGGNAVVILGVAGLNFFLGVALFLFPVMSFFPDIWISFWEWRSELITWNWDWNWSHLTFYLQKSFHFLDDSGMWAKPHALGCTLDQLGCPVSSKNMHPLH